MHMKRNIVYRSEMRNIWFYSVWATARELRTLTSKYAFNCLRNEVFQWEFQIQLVLLMHIQKGIQGDWRYLGEMHSTVTDMRTKRCQKLRREKKKDTDIRIQTKTCVCVTRFAKQKHRVLWHATDNDAALVIILRACLRRNPSIKPNHVLPRELLVCCHLVQQVRDIQVKKLLGRYHDIMVDPQRCWWKIRNR